MMQYRQGDVLLREVPSKPQGLVAEKRQGDIILALGEVTGHAHRIADKTVLVWFAAGQRYIEVQEPGATLKHEEHAPIAIAPGLYEVVQQREWDLSGEVRPVTD